MHLKDFLRPPDGRKLSNAEFGRQIGRSEATIYRWVEGEAMPGPEGLRQLFKATDGQVTATDMLNGLKAKREDANAL
jgi:transcriptional regulator with XRE-family HTH domain